MIAKIIATFERCVGVSCHLQCSKQQYVNCLFIEILILSLKIAFFHCHGNIPAMRMLEFNGLTRSTIFPDDTLVLRISIPHSLFSLKNFTKARIFVQK